MKYAGSLTFALSIRQPWAWLICHGIKRLENRTWTTSHRGGILIHTGKHVTPGDDAVARCLAEADGFTIPPLSDLPRGGIVGRADLVDVINYSTSQWFMGPLAFVLENAAPLPFKPLLGRRWLFPVDPFAPEQQLTLF